MCSRRAVLMISVVLGMALIAAGCGDDGAGEVSTPLDGCETADAPAPIALETAVVHELADDGSDHLACDPGYPSSPPASGAHFDAWQNCGFYTAAVRDHTAVHSLEHGAVWIAYAPATSATTVEAIAARVEGTAHLLAAPYPGLANPFVLTAWRRQLAVDSWDDPLVEDFIDDFAGRVSPTAPEAGASCEGAVGAPPDDPDDGYDEIFAEVAG